MPSVASLLLAASAFVILVASGMFVYGAASSAWALARRRYQGSGSAILEWKPNDQEGSLQSGVAFLTFFFNSHRSLNDKEIDALCRRVRWGLLLQLFAGTALLYVVEHA